MMMILNQKKRSITDINVTVANEDDQKKSYDDKHEPLCTTYDENTYARVMVT